MNDGAVMDTVKKEAEPAEHLWFPKPLFFTEVFLILRDCLHDSSHPTTGAVFNNTQ